MAKSVLVAYLYWLCGGWFGLHHLYLGRDRQAFVWACLFGGYAGVGWFVDLFHIPSYVREANLDECYLGKLMHSMKTHPKPPFSLYRFSGQILLGNLLGWLISRAIPEEMICGYSLHWLDILIPLGPAISVYTVGNIGREKGSFKTALLGAYLPYIWYTYNFPLYSWSSFLAAFAFRRYVQWDRRVPKQQSISRRLFVLGTCYMIYLSLWGSYFYFNVEVTNEYGETVKFGETIRNSLGWKLFEDFWNYNAKAWLHLRYYGLWSLFEEMLRPIEDDDLMTEMDAFALLELPASATPEIIKKQWRFLSRQNHPDKFTIPLLKQLAHEKFLDIQRAYKRVSARKFKRRKNISRIVKH